MTLRKQASGTAHGCHPTSPARSPSPVFFQLVPASLISSPALPLPLCVTGLVRVRAG